MASLSDRYILLRDGRKLGYAEYGDPQGKPVFLFHGIPGSRMMQHPDASIAIAVNVRLIVPERPGMGLSDFKPRRKLLDWPMDVEELANQLGITEFTVAGISGGGPYAAACGFAIPHRLISVGIISGVGPTNTPGVLKGMLSSNRMGYSVGRWMPWFFWRMVFNLYYGEICHHPEKLAKMQNGEPEIDQIIFAKPGVRQVFIRNFAEAFRQGTVGAARDGWLLSRPWGFALKEISVPVYLWQGEADVIVTPAMGRYMATQIPKCYAKFLPGEGHLVFITHWQEILKALTSLS
jgi:pimeloyl-ACP methyl ester carboxylesterase